MGNWLKGRVLMLNDVSMTPDGATQQDRQVTNQIHDCQLAEEEQILLAKRIGLIQHLPTGIYDGSSKSYRECVICMVEFSKGDSVRFLPCMHTYHVHCIDDWLMRSFICPSCMEPVDVALLNTM